MAPGGGHYTQSTAKVTIPSLIPNPKKGSGHNGGGPVRGIQKMLPVVPTESISWSKSHYVSQKLSYLRSIANV